MNRPGNSLELDPIRNGWNYVKEKLKIKDTGFINMLITTIELLWTIDLSGDYCSSRSSPIQCPGEFRRCWL
jgi:hypothetical protein